MNPIKNIQRNELKRLLCFLTIGLIMVVAFSGKSRMDIESIAVSSDEQYIACFETGNGDKIRTFHSDGSAVFTYNIPVDISAGGHCALWFEEDVLCALFYRTDKIVYFTLNGSIRNIAENTLDDTPHQFPSFFRKNHQYVFCGNEIEVVYNKGGFFDYWFFGAKRYLAITPKNKEMNIVYDWTARQG